jgi:RNA polymerase sigma-70 factor, ECF subfamily
VLGEAVINQRQLRERVLAGDETAFELLFGPLIEPGLRLAYSMLGDRGEAEDATQEASIRAWRKINQLRTGASVRAWFLAIVANQCRFHVIRIGTVSRASRLVEPDVEHLDIERGLARLPERDREALFLHFYLDLPIEEVAAVMKLSAAAAKARVYRACHRLRPGLVEEG